MFKRDFFVAAAILIVMIFGGAIPSFGYEALIAPFNITIIDEDYFGYINYSELGGFGGAGALYNDSLKTQGRAKLTIKGGSIYNNKARVGGAIANLQGVLNTNGVQIYSNSVEGFYDPNPLSSGGAIYSFGTYNDKRSYFRFNKAEASGGAIMASGKTTLDGSTFHYNEAKLGGGAVANYGGTIDGIPLISTLTVKNVLFEGNRATGQAGAVSGGGAILNINDDMFGIAVDDYGNQIGSTWPIPWPSTLSRAIANISGGTFILNSADKGGAIANIYGTLKTNKVTFTQNTGIGGAVYNIGNYTDSGSKFLSNIGSAVYNELGTATLKGSIFLQNDILYGSGGAVYNNGTLNVISSTFGDYDKVNNTYRGNTAAYGGAIYNGENGIATITGSKFQYNGATHQGGAINNNGQMTVKGSTFIANTTDYSGGAIYNEMYKTLSINSSKFLSNSASDGGAIYNAEYGIYTDNKSTFSKNSASNNGGAMGIGAMSTTTLNGTKFDSNYAANDGGAIYNSGDLNINNARFDLNSAGRNGGAITANLGYGNFTINKTAFNKNSAERGGAIYLTGPYLSATGSTFISNTALYDGGAIYNDGYLYLNNKTAFKFNSVTGDFARGGALYNGYNSAFSIRGGTSFVSNTAKNANNNGAGGAIANFSSADNITEIGFIGEQNIIDAAAFTTNSANLGGAIYNEAPASGVMTINKSTFNKNTAVRGSTETFTAPVNTEVVLTKIAGGAIYNESGKITINSSAFNNNSAVYKYIAEETTYNDYGYSSNSGALNTQSSYGLGGAVYNNGEMEINSGTTFKGNIAGSQGGAIYNEGTLTIDNATFQSNSANSKMDIVISNQYESLMPNNNYKDTLKVNEYTGHGGAIFNNEDGFASITGGTFKSNVAAQQGGAIANDGTLTVDGTIFQSNTAKTISNYYYIKEDYSDYFDSYGNLVNAKLLTYNTDLSFEGAGGAIFNYGDAYLQNAQFIGNTAIFGGAIANAENLVVENSIFKNNNAKCKSTEIYSMEAYNTATGKKVEGWKDRPDVYGDGEGGAMVNRDGNVYISGSTFTSNSSVLGGAIANGGHMIIENSTFTSNSAKDTFSPKADISGGGGAIATHFMSTTNIRNSTFNKNISDYGGAIATRGGTVNIVDSSFTNNIAGIKGGAIYAFDEATVNIIANNKDVVFQGNKAAGKSNAIHLVNSTLNLEAANGHYIRIYDDISAEDEIDYDGGISKRASEINVYSDRDYNNDLYVQLNKVTGVTVSYNAPGGILHLADEANFTNNILNLSGMSTLSLVNGRIGTLNLNSFNFTDDGTVNLALDVNLRNGTADSIVASSVTGAGSLNVNTFNIIDESPSATTIIMPFPAFFPDDIPLDANFGADPILGRIFKYRLDVDKLHHRFGFTRVGFNPVILASSVAAQAGGYLNQLNSYEQAFTNMDMRMLLTRNEREALKLQNRYASTYPGTFSSEQNRTKDAEAWFRPYATFEKVGLKNGPNVSNTAYGSYFGGDTQLFELKNGFEGSYGVYVGYNGSHQNYDGVSIYQNGGTLGFVGTLYKGNFFTGLTANVGANGAEANTYFGSENFSLIMSGIASKTGYNFEFAQGKFIIQPSFLMSYSFINTFDYTNAAGVRITSDPLSAIQLSPGIKFIGNLKNGWQPYLGVNMVWNIMDQTRFKASDITLPQLAVKPFVEYGIGVQKRWGERFSGFGQAMIRNGGRNGIALSFGFKISLGQK